MNAAALLVALFNGAWQGAVVCAVAYLALRSLRRVNAATMFAVWGGVWAICLLLPVANDVFAAKASTGDAWVTSPQQIVAFRPSSTERGLRSLISGVPRRPAGRARAGAALPERAAAPPRAGVAAALRVLLANAGIILWVLAAVATVRLMLLVRDIRTMLMARGRVRIIDPPVALRRAVRRPLTFASSPEFSSPCVLGFVPTIVVIPETILSGSKERLHSVVLHECEHARRFDDVQNVVMRFVGALAFMCPGVLVAQRRLALYREQICDDAVLADTGDAVAYAKTLAHLAEWTQTVPAPSPCLIFERKHLLRRVHVLLDGAAVHSLRLDRRFTLAAVAGLGLAAALVLRVQVPVIADPGVTASFPETARLHADDSDIHIHDHDGKGSASRTAARAPKTFAGTFELAGCAGAGQVRLRLEYHHFSPGHLDSDDVAACVPFSELRGISVTDLASRDVVHRTFTIVRDAGTMQAQGRIGNGAGSGTWTFVPSSSFVAELQRRGIGAPSAMQQFEWMLSDFQLATLDALRRNGFARPSVPDLVTMGEVGVTDRLIDLAGSLPSQTKTVRQLNRLAEVGVTPSYIGGLERLGYHTSLEELIRLKELDVTPDYVAGVKRLGYRPSAEELMRLKEVGVTPSWIQNENSRVAHPSIDELIRLKERGF
ncbi:MAG: M56 family metallopeptidase [Candidatus Eremiobacteraeota bacterium]|nr:M56 family metallopeptidase [Candidatus Eremiobacteraeota bacterium]MBC5804287.1 M56 family metallopeptidase [Candidatus Eremiobacteraeota bacterium]MBC5822058.1 M56 family metallopeptidase [Candidatus Eremiobacteraeota bacterium]